MTPSLASSAVPTRVPLEPRNADLSAILVGVAFGCSTLWDFYWVTVRPMDFVAVILLVAAVLFREGSSGEFGRSHRSSAVVPLSLLGGIIVIYGVIGMLVDVQNAKPVTGIVLSVLAMFAIVAGAATQRSRVVCYRSCSDCDSLWGASFSRPLSTMYPVRFSIFISFSVLNPGCFRRYFVRQGCSLSRQFFRWP